MNTSFPSNPFELESYFTAENEKKTKDLKEEVQSSDEEEEYIPKSKRLKMKRMQEMEEEKRQLSKMKKPSHGVWTSGKSGEKCLRFYVCCFKAFVGKC